MVFIRKIYCALENVMDPKPEKIYICSFNESEGTHLHFHLIPVPKNKLPFKGKYRDWGNKGPVLYFILSTFKDWERLDEIDKILKKMEKMNNEEKMDDKKWKEYFEKLKGEYYDGKLKEGEEIIKKLKRQCP